MIRVQRPFFFRGRVPFSKSWLARALILRSLHPQVRILDWEAGPADGEDVQFLDAALKHFASGGTDFHIGESGTGLRFLLARLSVQKGLYTIAGSERLLSRPHTELIRVLSQLGATVERIAPTKLKVEAAGWPSFSSEASGSQAPVEIPVDGSESSQFRSALLLAASHIQDPKARPHFVGKNEVSRGYLEMTEDLVDQVISRGRRVLVPEPDASSIATLAAIVKAGAPESGATTAHASEAEFLWRELEFLRSQVEGTKQPDRAFFHLYQLPEADLTDAPDLFPVLAALASCGLGPCVLKGAPHLRHKETDRIAEIEKLLSLIGVEFETRTDGIVITPISKAGRAEWERRRKQGFAYQYSPPSDHRLAFAAAVLAAQGAAIEFHGRGMVAKSFPMFWSIVEGDAPKVAIIGHRGTGKTELARRWAHWLGARATAVDLDREIERLSGKSTRQLFEEDGEREFRFYERKAFYEMDTESRSRLGAFLVSCGAGFDVRLLDDSWQKIWVRRETDADGRIFFGRPRLDPELSPREESQRRFVARTPGFEAASDREYWLPEGEQDPAEPLWAQDLFDEDSISNIGGTITLLPKGNLVAAIARYLRWGVARIEIRDDLFPHETYAQLWEHLFSLPPERLLISFREVHQAEATMAHIKRQLARPETISFLLDWSFDPRPGMLVQSDFLHELPDGLRELLNDSRLGFVASRHQPLGADGISAWENLEAELLKMRTSVVMKLALPTKDFADLKHGHEWMMRSPSTRIFLPMSTDHEGTPATRARWTWYRLWRGSGVPQALNFWRDGAGSAIDQPSFSSWWRRERFASDVTGVSRPFAAVLGDPVHHSRTPLEHDRFFTSYGLPVFAISVRRDEAETAFLLLEQMGLRAAAVTSPLKESASQFFVNRHGETESREYLAGPVNTLVRTAPGWTATSTDAAGFEALWKEAEDVISQLKLSCDVVVWGGGGVLPALEPVLSRVTAQGGRVQHLRASQPAELGWTPSIVIWASGAQRGAWPTGFQPRLVVDLSYTDDSEARAIAIEAKSRYISGLTMFRVQAEQQREFWLKHFDRKLLEK